MYSLRIEFYQTVHPDDRPCDELINLNGRDDILEDDAIEIAYEYLNEYYEQILAVQVLKDDQLIATVC